MNIQLTQKLPKLQGKKLFKKPTPKDNHCLVVLVDEDGQPLASQELGDHSERIHLLTQVAHFKGKQGETLSDYALDTDAKANPIQLLLVGVGQRSKLNAHALQKIAKAIYDNLHRRVTTCTVVLGDAFDDIQGNTSESFTQFALGLLNASYRFDKYKSDTSTPMLGDIYLLADKRHDDALQFVQAVFTGQKLTRDVANEPGNVCYPQYMANQALQLAKAYPDMLKVTVLDEKHMHKLGMNCFLAVANGSSKQGQLVILEYYGQSKFTDKASKNKKHHPEDAPIALVGKGVTFDSGGISIKPSSGMDEMKFDMGGSAAVLGTVKALCEAKLPINVVAALACAENMPSGDATRPGDIVTAMNGKTVEILNTDAEGRLVLADTLSYIERYQPKVIIDAATLTGAMVVALGHVRTGLFGNDEDVIFDLQNAAEQSGDLVWHMPMDDEYQSQLDSPIADMQNIGERYGGSITAACFLSRFIDENQAWAHLDIAGTAWSSGKNKGATGRPVPLFMTYLKNASLKNASKKSH